METEVVWRPERHEAIKPYVDRLDRQHLHLFNPLKLLEPAALQGVPVDIIPGEYWTLDLDGDGFSVAVVACPCGQTPNVTAGSFAMCRCERAYLFTGADVSVLNSPKGRGSEETEPTAAA